ncbi:Conserved_hypothetical protein [Hexamita inflata]|uniref:Uncharacterized protein n=1 Tax=Hexamita inflata TaxID=28002 RepID=A0AA86Q2H4_9EUKA|nr:Conserved hypothetical protein [Hexamita inflata]
MIRLQLSKSFYNNIKKERHHTVNYQVRQLLQPDEPFSNDELFATSGVITYLGDNPHLKSLFAPVIGKVVKVPADHHDMIQTLYDIVRTHTGMNLPSSRKRAESD